MEEWEKGGYMGKREYGGRGVCGKRRAGKRELAHGIQSTP